MDYSLLNSLLCGCHDEPKVELKMSSLPRCNWKCQVCLITLLISDINSSRSEGNLSLRLIVLDSYLSACQSRLPKTTVCSSQWFLFLSCNNHSDIAIILFPWHDIHMQNIVCSSDFATGKLIVFDLHSTSNSTYLSLQSYYLFVFITKNKYNVEYFLSKILPQTSLKVGWEHQTENWQPHHHQNGWVGRGALNPPSQMAPDTWVVCEVLFLWRSAALWGLPLLLSVLDFP